MPDWIANNKDWLFSGIAIVIPLTVIGWFISTRENKSQIQKSGRDSLNIQVGDVTIHEKSKDE
jgi:hypothetical protein